jgi:hypothetical protein
MWADGGWKRWRCRIGRIRLKPGAKIVCHEACGNFF